MNAFFLKGNFLAFSHYCSINLQISYVDDPFFYQQNVYILVSCNPDDPEAGKSQYYAYYHVPKEEYHYFFT